MSTSSNIMLSDTAEDGMQVTLKADKGAFKYSEDLSLEVSLVSEKVAKETDKELESETKNDNIAKRVAYDVKVMHNGVEIEPVDGKKVKVEFTISDVPSGADAVNVYHIDEKDGVETIVDEAPVNEKTESVSSNEKGSVIVTENGNHNSKSEYDVDEDGLPVDGDIIDNVTVSGETDSFSVYAIDFTYDPKTINIPVDSTGTPLSSILSAVGIKGEINEAKLYYKADCSGTPAEKDEIKNNEEKVLLKLSKDNNGTWYLSSEYEFDGPYGLEVTIGSAPNESKYSIGVRNGDLFTLQFNGTQAVGGTFSCWMDHGPVGNIDSIAWTIDDAAIVTFSDDTASITTTNTGGHSVELKGKKEGTTTLTAKFKKSDTGNIEYTRTATVTIQNDNVQGLALESSRKPNLFIVGWEDAWNYDNGGDPIKYSYKNGTHEIVIDVKPELWQRVYNNIDQADGIQLGMYLDKPDNSVTHFRCDYRGDGYVDELMRSMVSSNPDSISNNNKNYATRITLMKILEDDDHAILTPLDENAIFGYAWFTSNNPKTSYTFEHGENFELIRFHITHTNNHNVATTNESQINEHWLKYATNANYIDGKTYQMGRLTYTLDGDKIPTQDYNNKELTTRLSIPGAKDITFKRNDIVSDDAEKISDGIYDINTVVENKSTSEYRYEIEYAIGTNNYHKILTIYHVRKYDANDFDAIGFTPVQKKQIVFDPTTVDRNRGFSIKAIGNTGELVTEWTGKNVNDHDIAREFFVKAPAGRTYTGLKYWTAEGGIDLHSGEDKTDLKNNTLLKQNRHNLENGGAYLRAFFLPEGFEVAGRTLYSLSCRSTGVDETDLCLIAWEYKENDQIKYDFQYYYWTTETRSKENDHTSVNMPYSVHTMTGSPEPVLVSIIDSHGREVDKTGINLDIKYFGQSELDSNGGFDYYRISLVDENGKRVNLDGKKAVVRFSYPEGITKEIAERIGFHLDHYANAAHTEKNEESIRYESNGIFVTLTNFSPFMLEWGEDNNQGQDTQTNTSYSRSSSSSSYSYSKAPTPKAATTPILKTKYGSQMMGTSVISKPLTMLTEIEKALVLKPGTKVAWSKDAYGYYQITDNNGNQIKNSWALVSDEFSSIKLGNTSWYYLDSNGHMLTGWQWIQGSDKKWHKYFLNDEDGTLYGACLLGGSKDGKTLNAEGQVVENGVVLTSDTKPYN